MYLNPTFGKVGQKLRNIRKSYGWTLQKTCDAVIELSSQLSKDNPRLKSVKLNPAHLSKIENNEVDTSDYYIALLCEVYKIKMSDLYKDDNEEGKSDSSLLHLPPHIREFISQPDNYYLLNMAYNMKKFDEKDMHTIREFMRIINI